MGKHLVLVGGGHAHMMTLAGIATLTGRGHRVTVVGPSEHHYYSGMGPGMLGGTYTPGDIRFRTRHVVEKQGGRFLLGSVERIDPDARRLFLASGATVDYDVASFNAGSHVSTNAVDIAADQPVFMAKPIERLMEARRHLLERCASEAVRIGIVGGGPSAVEISGNVWQLARDSGGHLPDIHILTGGRMMEGFPESVRSRVLAVLDRRGIRIVEGDYVRAIRDGRITTASGRSLATDLVFLAMGVKPSGIFSASGLPTGPDGGLQVNRFLQCPAHPEIFGGGDCIHFADQPLDKVGVYAVRQNPVLLHNLTAALEGGGLVPFDPGGDYLLIFNLGGGVGVLRKRSITFGGRAAFWIKDVIDRKFMRKFQAIEAP